MTKGRERREEERQKKMKGAQGMDRQARPGGDGLKHVSRMKEIKRLKDADAGQDRLEPVGDLVPTLGQGRHGLPEKSAPVPVVFRNKDPGGFVPVAGSLAWLDFIDEGKSLILNKDGSILAGFSFEPVHADDITVGEINAKTEALERAFSVFDARHTAWWILDKRKSAAYPQDDFDNATAEAIDFLYKRHFMRSRFTLSYTFYVLMTPAKGTRRFFERFEANEGKGWFKALFSSLFTDSFASFEKDTARLKAAALDFERLLERFLNVCPLTVTRLRGDAFLRSLSLLVNRTIEDDQRSKPEGALIDGWIGLEYVETHRDSLLFTGTLKKKAGAALAVSRWPASTTPALLTELCSLDMELMCVQTIRFLDSNETEKEIGIAIEYYRLTRYALFSHALAHLTGAEPTEKADKATLLAECEDAKTYALTKLVNFCYVSASFFVFAKDSDSLEDGVSRLARAVSRCGFEAVRERLNLTASFFAAMPGQWALQSRYDLVSLENASDLAPVYGSAEGDRIHKFFTEDVYGEEKHAFAVFGNKFGGTYYFSPHVGQVGHTVIIAPTGSGKTTFVNFCLSQFKRYGKVKTFIFDRNRSCEIVTALHGGTSVVMDGSVGLNPFFALQDDSIEARHWLREFVLNRLTDGGYKPTAKDRNDVDEAISRVASSGMKRMSELVMLLPNHLAEELSEWTEGRPYGLFDSPEDALSLTDWTAVEMGELLGIERLARAFMEYAFRKILMALDGTPAFIYLEEASFLLSNERFAKTVDEWLKTFRKKNAFVWMSLQSPEAITSKEIAASVLDNVFTAVMLPNERIEAHREGYRRFFALTDRQIDLIKTLKPHRECLLLQKTRASVIDISLPPDVLCYLRSEASVMNLYDRYKRSGDRHWMQSFLKACAMLK